MCQSLYYQHFQWVNIPAYMQKYRLQRCDLNSKVLKLRGDDNVMNRFSSKHFVLLSQEHSVLEGQLSAKSQLLIKPNAKRFQIDRMQYVYSPREVSELLYRCICAICLYALCTFIQINGINLMLLSPNRICRITAHGL